MSENNLHISIAATPDIEFGNPKILEHDLRLTKASILYADRVKLCSMTVWMATSFHLIGNLPTNTVQQFDILMSFVPAIESLNPNTVNLLELQNLHQLLKRNPILLTRKEKIKISRFTEKFPEIWEKLRIEFNEKLDTFGFDEIKLAIKNNLLEIHPFSSSVNDELAQEYVSVVQDILNSTNTHPMFDEETNKLVKLGLEEGKILTGIRNIKKSKQIGLVADLFDRLPVFDIKMDELLDLRNELQRPLVSFRAEMINLSNDIETAVWDKDFPSDVQTTYQSNVEPALQEIEEKLQSVSFKKFWERRIVDKYGYLGSIAGSSYALGAAISPLSGIAAAIIGTGLFIEAGRADLNDKINEIERNGLYFYYRVKKHANN